jgi:hypothetical protein
MPTYLRKSVHLAIIEDSIVALDIDSNRYSLISCSQPNNLIAILETSFSGSGDIEGSDLQFGDTLAEMEAANLLTKERVLGKCPELLTPLASVNEIPSCDVRDIPRLGPRQSISIFKAVYTSLILLKVSRLSDIFQRVSKIRSRHSAIPRPGSAEIADRLDLYIQGRTLFLDWNDRCLVNSLALLNYLAPFGIFPHWVFGVQLYPFAAHCWLEDDQFIYGESFTYCRSFSIILRV